MRDLVLLLILTLTTVPLTARGAQALTIEALRGTGPADSNSLQPGPVPDVPLMLRGKEGDLGTGNTSLKAHPSHAKFDATLEDSPGDPPFETRASRRSRSALDSRAPPVQN